MDRTARIARPHGGALADLADLADPAAQAFRLLHVGFAVLPIVFGLDKFTNFLTDWTQYLAPFLPDMLGVSKQTFMYGVGVVEIIAGILVALKPRYAAYVVAAWLVGIIGNLLILGSYFDVALRDFGLLVAALALARLAQAHAVRTRSAARPASIDSAHADHPAGAVARVGVRA
jgi:uncharacterized membrane protein YphA (DoxX/SURF4 family)